MFHFLGNLNWCMISSFSLSKVNRYDWAAAPIMTYLKSLGLKPYLTERNAIEVDGWKLSGQAQFTNRKNVLSHGTLLIEPGQARLQAAIEASKALKIKSKATSSVRSKTSSISDILKREISLNSVLDYFKQNQDFQEEALALAAVDMEKFQSHEWIWERCPNFYALHEFGEEELELQVSKDKIIAVKNKKGHLLVDSPLLNQTYESFLESYG